MNKIEINDSPKWFKACIMLLPLIGILLIKFTPDNDFYFLYPTGEYILNNGIPVKDFLSFHSSMDIVIQQWLSTIIFYGTYKFLGEIGLIALLSLCYIVTTYLIFKLSFLISNNYFISCITATISSITLALLFIRTRPQMFSYIVFLLELIFIEKYLSSKKTVYLFTLPVLSVLLINIHASMWLLFFVFAVPYVVSVLPSKQKKQNVQLTALIITGFVCFAAGLLNPYKHNAMLYSVKSFGVPAINELIGEMKAPDFSSNIGIIFFTILAVLVAVSLIAKVKCYSVKYILLFCGSLILALISIRSIALFCIIGLPAFTYLVKDNKIFIKIGNEKKQEKPKKKVLTDLILATLIVSILASTALLYDEKPKVKPKTEYQQLDEISNILEKLDNVVLYTGFEWGPYMEYKGFHPYIDCRAELFLKQNNHEYDYICEYMDLINGCIYYKDFLEKYNFNYLVISKGETVLYEAVIHDSDYNILYEGEKICLFESGRKI